MDEQNAYKNLRRKVGQIDVEGALVEFLTC